MPVTKLDPSAALVVIDLQKGLAVLPAVDPIADVISRTARIARAFRQRGLPVVLVNVTGMAPGRTDAGRLKYALPPDWDQLVPELEQQPGDHLISKQRWGAFIGTSLDEELRKKGVTQVFLTGVATSAGVESTGRSAYDHGYHVAFVVDAMTDLSEAAHRHTVENIFPRLGETDTTDNVLKLLKEPPAAQ